MFIIQKPVEDYIPLGKGTLNEFFLDYAEVFKRVRKEYYGWEFDLHKKKKKVSYEVLAIAFELMVNGSSDDYIDVVLDYEIELRKKISDITNQDLLELIIIKKSVMFLRYNNVDKFMELCIRFCTNKSDEFVKSKIAEKLNLQ